MMKLSLGGEWQYRRVDQAGWLSGTVPGSLALDMLRNQAMEDPFYRDNEEASVELFNHTFVYKREFSVDHDYVNQDRICLVCRGLDTLAQVYINGVLLAETDNMHRTYEFNIKHVLKAGTNEIRIIFLSSLEYIKEQQSQSPLWGIPMVVDGFAHLRKAHYMFGWDWGPKIPDLGIWRDIEIISYTAARLSDVFIQQEHQDDQVELRIAVELDNERGMEHLIEVSIVSPDKQLYANRQVKIIHQGHITISMDQPELWWPNGYGKQPLYRVAIELLSQVQGSAQMNNGLQGSGSSLDVLDSRTYTIGLRRLTVNTDADQWGNQFAFQINGVKMFAMGGNYIPEDNLLSRYSREKTELLIQQCVKANFNTIRVWGGGIYPDDYFYDLCDQYGLVVWQDLMYACTVYELTDKFRETIIPETADNLKRIRHHASLGLICGNNEIEMFWALGRYPESVKLKADYLEQFEQLLPEVARQSAPDTFYWLSSPSSGGGFVDPNGEERGNGHYWDVWHGNLPFTAYRKHYYRFMSEFGFESLPCMRTIEAFTEPEDRNIFSYVMESHQKNPDGNKKILGYLAETFQYPKDLDALVYVSQILQAEAMRYGVEHWRRNRGRCMGALYWQINDCWPVSSWSSIDYYGRWKALHYMAKRFYAPVLISAMEEGSRVEIHITNETRDDFEGQIKWHLRRNTGQIIRSGGKKASVKPLSTDLEDTLDFAAELKGKAVRETYLSYELFDLNGKVSDGTVLFVPPKHFQFQKTSFSTVIEYHEGEVSLSLTCDTFAKFVEIQIGGMDAGFSDNYFDLSPGDVKNITININHAGHALDLSVIKNALSIRSCKDTY